MAPPVCDEAALMPFVALPPSSGLVEVCGLLGPVTRIPLRLLAAGVAIRTGARGRLCLDGEVPASLPGKVAALRLLDFFVAVKRTSLPPRTRIGVVQEVSTSVELADEAVRKATRGTLDPHAQVTSVGLPSSLNETAGYTLGATQRTPSRLAYALVDTTVLPITTLRTSLVLRIFAGKTRQATITAFKAGAKEGSPLIAVAFVVV